jgi:hypothetical protein
MAWQRAGRGTVRQARGHARQYASLVVEPAQPWYPCGAPWTHLNGLKVSYSWAEQ